LTTSETKTLDEIGGIPVTVAQAPTASSGSSPTGNSGASVVYVRDIAQVYEGTEDKLMIITGDGEPAAQINVTRQIGGNIVNIEQEALNKISELKRVLPPKIHIATVYDLAEFVRESIASVR